MLRRHDIDWLRVIAIGLLLIYHIAIGFQPWGVMIGFITTEKLWESLWIPMAMLNVWRIPLLFFVSGMGVYFAMRKRDLKQLLVERGRRIFIPFLFGVFFIVPVHIYLWQEYYNIGASYNYHPGHLWFLGNIMLYILIFAPLFFFLKRNEDGKVSRFIKRTLSHPMGFVIVIGAFVLEAIIIKPVPYELYAMSWHGFVLGMLAFFIGFCFMLAGSSFTNLIVRWRFLFLLVAASLFIFRITQLQQFAPSYLLSIESNFWVFTVFGFGFKYLNRPGKNLSYLSQAAYPVYIIHMVFLYMGALLIFPLEVGAPLQFVLILLFTITGCMVFYEFVIRRVGFLRVIFGLKNYV